MNQIPLLASTLIADWQNAIERIEELIAMVELRGGPDVAGRVAGLRSLQDIARRRMAECSTRGS